MRCARVIPGFTLIEAMAALLLASVGLLALARLQVTLAGDGSAALQRVEAQGLLIDKIEQMRQLDSTQMQALPAGSDQPATASTAAFTRSWTWVQGVDPAMRAMRVSVNWSDRNGRPQALSTYAMVQPPEGRMAAAVAQPMLPSQTIRGPLDRYIDIPLAAQPVGDGHSSFTILKAPTNTSVTFLTDDNSGRVTHRCTSVPLMQQAPEAAGCRAYNGVVLSGFVGGANQTVSVSLGPLSLPLAKTIAYPSGVDTSVITGADPKTLEGIECEYRLLSADSNFILSINGSATYRYTCVIPLAAGSMGWSGYLQLAGSLSLSLDARVCRYQYPDVAGSDTNRRNVQQYRNVTQSLFNQNYFFVIGSNCGSQDGLALVEHQRCSLLGLLCALVRT